MAGSGGSAVELGQHAQLCVAKLNELHLGPELDEVHHQEGEYDDAQHEHVFRCPLHLLGTAGDGVAVTAAGGAVLHREPECVDDVDDEEHRQAYRGNQRIPVGAEKLAHLVVGCRPDQGYRIHQHVKSYE